uniref:Uncharacterized protein n=1 Tax=Knipowitschia caucasica TaxID=637954 RepID=A0AAV2K288_KNICA
MDALWLPGPVCRYLRSGKASDKLPVELTFQSRSRRQSSIISLVGTPGSCHHHHGNVSVLLVAITMAMGVAPATISMGLLTRITMAIWRSNARPALVVCAA